jgi:hypothetical protein
LPVNPQMGLRLIAARVDPRLEAAATGSSARLK